jgi:dihydroorotate dehydrogenase
LTNTSRKIALEQYQRTEGGYSGAQLFETALERVGWASEILKGEKTLVAVGGVDSAERALKMRRAGADLVEVYTAFVYQGTDFVKTVASTLVD